MKFDSFPALVAAIMNDKTNANDALDLSLYQHFKNDEFLTQLDRWTGKSGGDSEASYEFRSS
jgi:hypothetical protein